MTIQSNVKSASAVNNLKQAGTDAKDAAVSQAGEYANKLTDVANNVGREVGNYVETATGYLNDATTRAKSAGQAVEAQIEANPLRSSAIALAAGIILGMLMRK